MASVAAASSSSSSRTSEAKRNDVFLSFRGEDTRNDFISHLYKDLDRKKIKTFIDDEGLRTGEEISQSLLKAIEESKIAIVVLSKGYASSTWCLEEVAKIIECKKSGDLIVVPVFYHVDPSDVRKQTGPFGEAFVKHQERFKQSLEKVQTWRAALTETANIAGFDSNSKGNRHEAELVSKIVDDILKRLNHMSPCYNKDLVGIEPRIKAIEFLLNLESKDVILVGIWGMGGMGKTTLARAIFNKICGGFEGAFFLEESQNFGLSCLRQKLLSEILEDPDPSLDSIFTKNRLGNMKILLVLDDVIDWIDIGKLIEDLKCFGPKSRIILTSRDRQVLKNCGVKHYNIYEIKGLDHNDALILFSQHAFKMDHPIAGYEMLSERAVGFGRGIPLALKVLGGSLFDKKDANYWESTLSRLKGNTKDDINNVLELSYHRLEAQEKHIFLDIACFFSGADKYFVEKIFEDYCTLDNLVDKSLITIEYNRIRIHDLLQDMGRKIVKGEHRLPGKRSRVWHEDDICDHVLTTNEGTETIEGLRLNMAKIEVTNLNRNAFSKMGILRIFDFYWPSQTPTGCEFSDHFFRHHYLSFDRSYRSKAPYEENKMRVHAPEGLEFASKELRFFRWVGYPLESLPSKFYWKKLVALIMPYSNIKQLSEGLKHSEKLKCINLMHSEHLIRMSDLSLTPNLESLILEGCTKLIEVPSSIDSFNKLVTLNLAGCTSLRSLPTGISTKFLSLVGCSNLEMAPEITSKMEKLYLDGTAVKELSVIELASRLKTLTLRNCSRLERIPDLSLTPNLETLDLQRCGNLIEVPPSIQSLNKLLNLILRGCTSLRRLPTGIRSRLLQLGGCSNLEMAPEITREVEWLVLDGTAIKELSVIKLASRLKTLTLQNCSRLERIPDLSLTPNLMTLNLQGCRNLIEVPPSIQSLNKLDKLSLCDCTSLRSLPTGIRSRWLELGGCSNLEMAPEITSKVECLVLHGTAIKELPVIELPSRLDTLFLLGCSRLESLPNSICELKSLKLLYVKGCSRLDRLPDDLGKLEALRELVVLHTAIRRVPSSASPTSLGLRSLYRLDLSYCQITEFPDNLGELSSPTSLCLRGNYFACIPASVKKLPNLAELDVSYCEKLQFLAKLSSRRRCRVDAFCCTSLEKTDWLKSPLEPGEKWSDFDLNLANCYKLDLNQVVKDYMEYSPKGRWSFWDPWSHGGCITILPGNEIPECFDIRNMDGSSLTIKPPSGLYVEQIRLHYAACVVLELQGFQKSDFSFFKLSRKITDKYGNEKKRIIRMLADDEGHGDHLLLMNYFVDSGTISFTLEFSGTGSYEVKKCGAKFIGAEPNE